MELQLKEVYMSEIQQTEQQVAIITGASRGIATEGGLHE